MKEIDIHSIEDFFIGNAEDTEGATGCTAIFCPKGAVCGVDVRGGAPATRETDLLAPTAMAETVHAVMICGGSAYGLAAADGALAYLEEHGIGFDVGVAKVPIVPAAALFDLAVGDPKCRPDREMGYRALVNAEKNDAQEGIHGAGTGASLGKLFGPPRAMKSGLGFYAEQVGELKVGAVVAVNCFGSVFDTDTHELIAGPLDEKKERVISTVDTFKEMNCKDFNAFSANTTLGCILTNAALTKAQITKVAQMAHNGYARTICPVHTSVDGDAIFALSSEKVEAHIDLVGAMAAEAMAKAVSRGVRVPSAYGFTGSLDL